MLTGRVVDWGEGEGNTPAGMIQRLIARSGEPVIRQALRQAMRILGGQFVLGRTIEEALAKAEDEAEQGYRFSFDMLGEAARTAADAERYSDALSRGGRGHRGLGGLAASCATRTSCMRGPACR